MNVVPANQINLV